MIEQSSSDTTLVDIVTHVADRERVSTADLPPLYDSVDPDALEQLLSRSGSNSGVSVSFTYYGYHITTHGDDRIYVDGELIDGETPEVVP